MGRCFCVTWSGAIKRSSALSFAGILQLAGFKADCWRAIRAGPTPVLTRELPCSYQGQSSNDAATPEIVTPAKNL
jgi:hypothetical protein